MYVKDGKTDLGLDWILQIPLRYLKVFHTLVPLHLDTLGLTFLLSALCSHVMVEMCSVVIRVVSFWI